jgi:glutaredoxin 3
MVKNKLRVSGVPFEERNIEPGGEWTKEQLLEAVPGAKTIPQVFIHGEYVGGYEDVLRYMEDHNMPNGNQGII